MLRTAFNKLNVRAGQGCSLVKHRDSWSQVSVPYQACFVCVCECEVMHVTYQVLLLIKEEQKQAKTTVLLLTLT